MLDAHPNAGGLGVYRDGGGYLHVWYQPVSSTIQHLFYKDNDFSIRTLETPISNAFEGTSISAYLDDAHNPHVFYQTNEAKNPVVDYSFWNGQWGTGEIRSLQPLKIKENMIVG